MEGFANSMTTLLSFAWRIENEKRRTENGKLLKMIVKERNSNTTFYLALFLIVDIVIVGVLLCFFSGKAWWNNWMVTVPNLFMVLGALFCPMMKKNVAQMMQKDGKMAWLLVYKGIKIALTAIMLALYILMVKEHATAFVLITAICYLVGLFVETFSILDYSKRLRMKQ